MFNLWYLTSSIIGSLTNKPKERLAPTLSMSTIAILNGVDILRVHDVSDTINAVSAINNYIKIEK